MSAGEVSAGEVVAAIRAEELGCVCGHEAWLHPRAPRGVIDPPGPRGLCNWTPCPCSEYERIPLGEDGSVEEAAGW